MRKMFKEIQPPMMKQICIFFHHGLYVQAGPFRLFPAVSATMLILKNSLLFVSAITQSPLPNIQVFFHLRHQLYYYQSFYLYS